MGSRLLDAAIVAGIALATALALLLVLAGALILTALTP